MAEVHVLVSYPTHGSDWIMNAEWSKDSVSGYVWSHDLDELIGVNYPLTCVQKVRFVGSKNG